MTARIRIIPETLSNKIAAGEVVSRPASVVKELVENSIDAGADEITVTIGRAGKGLIQVADNGCGMSKNDALLSIERFATSKIESEDDLFNIKTLGFRGEALPSIASVSRFTIITKTADELEGTCLSIEGGRLKNVRAAGAPTGTSIAVKNLFFNTPARLKFMKSNKVEMFHIADTVLKLAASRHDLHIKLISDDKVVADFAKTTSIYNRVCDIFSADTYKHLIQIDAQSDEMHIFGFVTNPVHTERNAKKLFTYINGRYVSDKIVNYAINLAYRSKIEERRYPAVVLFIEMPQGEVDVNVHPTKKDVRFKNQGNVIGYIESAIKNVLSSADLVGLDSLKSDDAPTIEYERIPFPADDERPTPSVDVSGIKDSMKEYLDRANELASQHENVAHESQPRDSRQSFAPVEYSYDKRASNSPAAQSEMYDDYVSILGQVGASFVVCTKGDNLLLIDQHAAHERILFDSLTKKYEEKTVSPQPLLIPIIFELSKSDAILLEGYLDEFTALGFVIEPFGRNSYAVKEVPDIILGLDHKEIVHDLISDLMIINKSAGVVDKLTALTKLLACKGAIKANRRLTEREIYSLLKDMSRTEFPTNCPHGRPVVIELSEKDIRKMFKRL